MFVTHRLASWTVGLGLAASLLCGPTTPAAALTLGPDGQPLTNLAGATVGVQAHRGGAGQWPENSREAYLGSVAAGYDSIETDIQFTSDGVAVMNHNDTLPSRCTSSGSAIHAMTLAQVAKVRCADLSGNKVVPVATFADLVAAVKGHDIGVTLDIKSYSGQSDSGKRSYAARTVQLLIANGMLAQTTILSFDWSVTLPTIRALAPTTPVLALDKTPSLARVRLADQLGATSYGATMAKTSVFFAGYITSLGMDGSPYGITAENQRLFSIYFGGPHLMVGGDYPEQARDDLLAGRTNINPVPHYDQTTRSAYTVRSAYTFQPNVRKYPTVMGTAIPTSKLAMLDSVTLAVTATNGPGKGFLNVGASGSTIASGTQVPLPKGTKTLTLKVPVGDEGRIRVFTTVTARLTVKVVGYTHIDF